MRKRIRCPRRSLARRRNVSDPCPDGDGDDVCRRYCDASTKMRRVLSKRPLKIETMREIENAESDCCPETKIDDENVLFLVLFYPLPHPPPLPSDSRIVATRSDLANQVARQQGRHHLARLRDNQEAAVPRVECEVAIPMAPAPRLRGAHQVGRPLGEEGKNRASPKLERGKDRQKEAAPRK